MAATPPVPVRTPEEIEADIQRSKAQAAQARAEAKRANVEARSLEAEAKAKELALRALVLSEQEEHASDLYHHVFRFNAEIGKSTVGGCMSRLAVWHRLDPGCDIEVIFTSPGGDVISGLALFDYIQELRASGHHVTTKASGYAASMAGILLQAGDVRVMNAEAWLLVHEASFGTGGKLGEVEDTVEWVKKVSKRVKDIFAKRSNLSSSQIEQRWRRKDWWIDADEALKLGFCDEIEGALVVPEKVAD